MERFKEIPGFSGYLISNRGKVYSQRTVGGGKSSERCDGKYELKLSTINTGYIKAMMWGDNKKKRGKLVHRLVAEAFIPNPHNYPVVLHNDNDVTNNWKRNLRWGTLSQNQQQSIREGRKNNPTGDNLPNIKNTLEVCLKVLTLKFIENKTPKQILEITGINKKRIYNICKLKHTNPKKAFKQLKIKTI